MTNREVYVRLAGGSAGADPSDEEVAALIGSNLEPRIRRAKRAGRDVAKLVDEWCERYADIVAWMESRGLTPQHAVAIHDAWYYRERRAMQQADKHGRKKRVATSPGAASKIEVVELPATVLDLMSGKVSFDDLPDEQPAVAVQQQSPTRRAGKLEWLPKAMLIVRDNPDWSDSRIAEEVGVNRSTLSRRPEYQAAAALARGSVRGNVPRGFKTEDGDIEAIEDF